ncbi:MAG: type II toxin-antitoxin system antitoxin SocA domain-containing protein [Acidobacteriota bacterium]
MAVEVLVVANHFLSLAEDEGGLDALKLQRLVYIAYGWSLVCMDRAIFSEKIIAGPYGPLIATLDLLLQRDFGEGKVANYLDPASAGTMFRALPSRAVQLIEFVWNEYKKFDGRGLLAMTNHAETPWALTRVHARNDETLVIEPSLIEHHYLLLAQSAA